MKICDLLKNVELFDIYTGNQIDEGKKSMAYKLTFQSKDKTLVDEDINSIIDCIVAKCCFLTYNEFKKDFEKGIIYEDL